jgi:hypothetical protein
VFNQGGALTLGGDYGYVGDEWESLQHVAGSFQSAHAVTNLHAIYTLPDAHYQVIVSGTNVTDDKYFKLAGGSNGIRFYEAPAEFSITLKYRNF